MPLFRPRIAIIGCGPSGLTLGQLLHKQGIRSTIYELRAKSTPEELAKPSGMLDLHEESGLAAIRECGLWDGFQAAVGDCSESMRVMNQAGVVLHADEGELSTRPEIARNALTNLLIQNVPSDTIMWKHKIKAVRNDHLATGATEVTLDLGANGSATYDLVIGADGAWSKVRQLFSDIRPTYSGAQYITATMRNVSTRHPRLLALSGSGSLCALGGGNGIMTQRGPQDSLRLYAAVNTPDEKWAITQNLQTKRASEIKPTLLADNLFGSWAPALQDLLATACDEETLDNPGAVDVKPYYNLPVGHRWTHRTGATLIGDAAHLMTPWAGEGVNLALWDALELARVLADVPPAIDAVAWQAALEPGMRQFEDTMLSRAEEKAQETARNQDLFLGQNGAQAMADFFGVYDDLPAPSQRYIEEKR